MNNKLLILDLDETLIHATENKLTIQEDLIFDKYFIYKRPKLDFFLQEISNHFKIGIWSSADDFYVSEIVKKIKPEKINLEFIWGRSRCSIKRNYQLDSYHFEKRLQKLKKKGFHLNKMIIVDDTPDKVKVNYGNAIYIKEYTGNTTDNELEYLSLYLQTLKNVQNIRSIEKRGWRSQI